MRSHDSGFLPGLVIEFLGIVILIAGGVTGNLLLLIPGVIIVCLGSALTIRRIIRLARTGGCTPDSENPAPEDTVRENPEDSKILYQDQLVRISENAITFHHYSFPLF